MEKLWIFGCSHSTSDFNLSSHDECWTSIVAKFLNSKEENRARSGASNDEICQSIIECLPLIGTKDKVIVLFTSPYRLIYNGETLMPSRESSEWWYKLVNSDDFYYRKFLTQVIAAKHLLKDVKALYTFVDPELLIKQFSNKTIKQTVMENSVLLPRISLSKSFPLGADEKHMSPEGHKMLAEFLKKHV